MIESIGVRFVMNTVLGQDINFESLVEKFDAVVVATGSSPPAESPRFEDGCLVTADAKTFATAKRGVFACGGVIGAQTMAVRAVGQGRAVAMAVHRFIQDGSIGQSPRLFNSTVGKISPEEIAEFLKESVTASRMEGVEVKDQQAAGRESSRCFHCDCRKSVTCRLRSLSDQSGAQQGRFKGESRSAIVKCFDHEELVFEPGKCIKCGLCVRTAEKYREPLGLSFVGRGFDVRIGVPFNDSLKDALKEAARSCAVVCPTGALCLREGEDHV